jgi:hypothetical protein
MRGQKGKMENMVLYGKVAIKQPLSPYSKLSRIYLFVRMSIIPVMSFKSMM